MRQAILDLIRWAVNDQAILIIIAGLVAPYFTNWVKSAVRWESRAALILSVAVSAGFAILAAWANGSIHEFRDVIYQAASIYAVAQIYYRTILKIEVPALTKKW
jgi:hypothetical protein